MTRVASETESSERVTVSSVPISRETRVLSPRAREVDPAHIDRLLVATCELPIARGVKALASRG
jgi:hypothetical protein